MSARRTTVAAGVLLLAGLPQIALTESASAGETMCRGLAATHVGTPGANLTTTEGADVVVTNGADAVKTLGGDDVICVTGDELGRVRPGEGDDLVDTRAFGGGTTSTYIGYPRSTGATGDDTVIGGNQFDAVIVFSGVADDHKQIDLGGGEDFVNVLDTYPGQVTANLGGGRDEYWNERPRAGVSVDGGPGRRDGFVTECNGCASLDLSLQTGAISVQGNPAGEVHGVEAVVLDNEDRDHTVPRAVLVGSAGDDYLQAQACRGEVRGLGGDDHLRAGAATHDGCAQNSGEMYGGAGDDTLWGRVGDDVLRGGPGTDLANGRDGDDLCRAEVRRQCEA